jgi:hypothetical protein
MSQIAVKLRAIAGEMIDDGRDLDFLAAFLPDDSPGGWDIVFSAPWAKRDRNAAIDYMAERVHGKLTKSQLMLISGIVVLDKVPDPISLLFGSVDIGQDVTASNIEIYDVTVRFACIILLKPSSSRKRKAVAQ